MFMRFIFLFIFGLLTRPLVNRHLLGNFGLQLHHLRLKILDVALLQLRFLNSAGSFRAKLSSEYVGLLMAGLITIFVVPDENVFAQQRRVIQVGESRQWMNDDEILQLSQKSHERGACPGFMDITDFPQKWQRQVAPTLGPVLLPPTQVGGSEHLFDGQFYLEPEVRRVMANISISYIEGQLLRLTSLHNRDYRSEWGVEAAQMIEDELKRLSSHRSDVRIEKIYHNGFPQPSILLQVFAFGPNESGTPRTRSATGNDAVILGAHFDTINMQAFTNAARSRARAPGADDNASGAVSVLEVARLLLGSDWRPKRDLIFLFYAGEERGLLGSQEIAERFRDANRAVAGALQLDMTMYSSYTGAAPQEGTNFKPLGVITDYVSPQLTVFIKAILDHYVRIPWVDSNCGYACSDHASWYDASYPSAFVIEAPMDHINRFVHSPEDSTEILSTGHGLPFVKMALAFMMELGGKAP